MLSDDFIRMIRAAGDAAIRERAGKPYVPPPKRLRPGDPKPVLTCSPSAEAQRRKRAKTRALDQEPYCMYALRDTAGVTRYIGISRRLENRLKSHARKYPELFPVVLMTNIPALDAFGLESDLQKRLPGLINRLQKGRPDVLRAG
jgi:hypothetical protein